MSFNNKVVLVTEASSGIGAAIALKFSEEGANVAIVGQDENKLKNVYENIAKLGNKPLIIVADVTKEKDAQRIVCDTLKQYGKLDVLVNNAGVGEYTVINRENVMADYDRIMTANLHSVVYLTHLAVKHLIETKGNILNISSIAGQKVLGMRFAYCAAKAGLDHFTKCIALEFAPTGVRVNAISSGPIKTSIMEGYGQTEFLWDEMLLRQQERLSEPMEIAELAVYLASNKAVGITGSIYVSDNGSSLSIS